MQKWVVWALWIAVSTGFAAKQKSGEERCLEELVEASARFEEAVVGLAEGNFHPAYAMLRAGATSPIQQLALWKLLLTSDFYVAMSLFGEMREVAPEIKKEAVRAIAEKAAPNVILEFLQKYPFDGEMRFELAKVLATSIEVGDSLSDLRLETESQRAEIARIQVLKGQRFWDFIESYQLESAEGWFPVLLALAEQGEYRESTAVDIGSFADREERVVDGVSYLRSNHKLYMKQNGRWVESQKTIDFHKQMALLSPDQVGQILAAYARASNARSPLFWIGTFKERFGVVPTEFRRLVAVNLLVALISEYGWERVMTSQFQVGSDSNYSLVDALGFYEKNFLGFERQDVLPTVLEILRGVPLTQIAETLERDQFLLKWFGGNLWELLAVSKELQEVLFELDAPGIIAQSVGIESLFDLHLVADAEGELDLTGVLRSFARLNPDLLPAELVEILWDKVRDPRVAVILLREFFYQQWDAHQEPPTSSLELLCGVTGLKYCEVHPAAISKNPIVFYQLLTDIQRSLHTPAFEGVDISPSVYEKKEEFLLLLRLLRDNFDQLQGYDAVWKDLLRDFKVSTQTLTEHNIHRSIEIAQERLLHEIQSKLRSEGIKFSYDQFKRLEERWGDLEPIWTLLSRFQSNSNWASEVRYLVAVFRAALEERFSDYKFVDGDAQDQLLFLSDKGHEAWKKERYLVSLNGAGGEDTDEELVRETEALVRFKRRIAEEILPLIPKQETELDSERWTEEILVPFLRNSVLGSDPAIATDKLLSEGEIAKQASPADVLWRLVADVLSSETTSLREAQAGMKVVHSLMSLHGVKAEVPLEEIKHRLIEIGALLKVKRKKRETEIIFSALTSAPKLLLTIGDVVNTASCQNYRTGGQIQSLLGYVIDANVQAMVSFALKQSDFEEEESYLEVVRAYENGQAAEVAWDGNKKIVSFTLKKEGGDLTVATRPLAYAYLRQMVKLGEHNGTPGIRLEKEYFQDHNALEKMREQHASLKSQLEEEMGATQRGPIQIKATRNPGGVYSDLAKGFHTSDYSIR